MYRMRSCQLLEPALRIFQFRHDGLPLRRGRGTSSSCQQEGNGILAPIFQAYTPHQGCLSQTHLRHSSLLLWPMQLQFTRRRGLGGSVLNTTSSNISFWHDFTPGLTHVMISRDKTLDDVLYILVPCHRRQEQQSDLRGRDIQTQTWVMYVFLQGFSVCYYWQAFLDVLLIFGFFARPACSSSLDYKRYRCT
jgi:hypothetical protein